MVKLLIVEDNEGLREQMKWALNDTYEILEAGSTQECSAVITRYRPPLICLDMGLDNEPTKGLEVIDTILHQDRLAKIIVITANTAEGLGPQAIAKGAFDFLRKPIDIEELRVLLQRAERILNFEARPQLSSASLSSAPNFEMVGQSEPMQKIFQLINRLATTEVNVLITGDSGTGKELCARAIHFHSQRKDNTFVPINCGAIPETLLESELFGYVKGAFTGANSDKLGLIESANGGSLFLDEIGDMSKHLQVKLLRFIEDQSFQRVGDPTLRRADVRIIAATNKKGLDQENNDSMRTDLYYRLSEFEIKLPTLKSRGSDVLLLADKIIERNRIKFSMPKLQLSSRSRDLLLHYSWPGNVRELENKLSRASITCTSQTIEPEDLQLSPTSITGLSFKDAKNMFEKNYLVQALKDAHYVLATAAKNMGISRPTLYDMMKKHEIAISFKGQIEE
jgi:two-component system NtrC family response regulator